MKKFFYVLVPTFCFLAIILVASSNVKANVNLDEKICFGIKRGVNHERPDLGSKNLEIFKKYNVYALGNENSKNIYLTFDLGYEAGYTSKILDVLKENDVKATFFITAHYLNTNTDLVNRMIKEGHIVGNHTVNHKCMPELSREEMEKEIMDLHTALYEKTGYEMKYIRPPKGEYSENYFKTCEDLNYINVMWSFAYDDWDETKQGRTEYGKKKILDNLHNGEIMLLHATSKDNSEILDECLKQIKNLGYYIKSLDEF